VGASLRDAAERAGERGLRPLKWVSIRAGWYKDGRVGERSQTAGIQGRRGV